MKLIFLDLDKTLLGDDYSPQPAAPILNKLKEKGFVIVFNSSKTRFEQEFYRKAWKIDDPFIVENGSGIYIPIGYFDFEIPKAEQADGLLRVKLGVEYSRILETLRRLEKSFELKYYGNSTLHEVMAFTGLPSHLAELAKRREFSETLFRFECADVIQAIERNGLKVTKGSRFYTVTGHVDKGIAASRLIELFRKLGDVETYGVGDGENDIPLFEVVDYAFVVGELRHPKAVPINDVSELLRRL